MNGYRRINMAVEILYKDYATEVKYVPADQPQTK